MSYENAPATKMLAVACAVCARPLVDSVSVQAGIGPDCREKHGYLIEVDEAVRLHANKLVHQIACTQKGVLAFQACSELHALGFQKLSDRIMQRLTKIAIEKTGDRLAVKTPFDTAFVDRVKQIPGKAWSKDDKVWTIPTTHEARKALYKALRECFPGKWARGPQGPFVIEVAA